MENGKSFLDAAAILGAADVRREEVSVPEWNGVVLVQGMTGAQRDEFEEACLQGKGQNRQVNLRNLRAKLVVRSVVDGAGNRIFSDDDAAKLGNKSAAALSRVFEVAQRLSGITKEDVEELAKNSEASPSGDSPTA